MTTNGTFSTSRITEVTIKKPSGLSWCCQVVRAAAPRCCWAPHSCHLQSAPGGCRGQGTPAWHGSPAGWGQAPPRISTRHLLFPQELPKYVPAVLCLPALWHTASSAGRWLTAASPAHNHCLPWAEVLWLLHRCVSQRILLGPGRDRKSRTSYKETPHFRSLENQIKKTKQIIS